MDLAHWLGRALADHNEWAHSHGGRVTHPATGVLEHDLEDAYSELARRLGGSYPFFHPRYAGQMLKPPHDVAVLGYLAAMLVNPNNHALDGGPATTALEEESVAQLGAMFGFEAPLGHLTSSGTIANLEALFVARESHPDRAVAFSSEAHYTHARMCRLLGIETRIVPVDVAGRMDASALREILTDGSVGTVVATAGTTGLGAVDPVHDIVVAAHSAGARVHVDAAYGGFFRLLCDHPSGLLEDPRPWHAISLCDSVVVDPHKHGLQPYGCGAVLFADREASRFFHHDSRWTYYSSRQTHLGEISLECSRSGASAAALWLTLKMFPLTADGLGAVLAAGRRAALRWADMLAASEFYDLYQRPELDIVTYIPRTEERRISAIDRASQQVFDRAAADAVDPIFLSMLQVDSRDVCKLMPDVREDKPQMRLLRSALMKPEFESYVPRLHRKLESIASGVS
ncbi:pyridoxal phosphate-dependent decarboxylase family protein [Streptomyces sp. NPDC058629]|uniref:pyridoxal phosphate-dependent decarboxylase family protein n=1 Tax=Streptomyces sp. NPDC058629 TaxID=3346565 RepID=UPI00366698FD